MSKSPEQIIFPSEPVSPELLAAIRQFTALLGIVIGLFALGGWVFGVEGLKTILSGAASMKVNTALGCLMLGAALLLGSQNRKPATALAAMAVALGTLTLCEYAFGIDFGIDQLLIEDHRSVEFPGCMAPATAFSILLLGMGILAILQGYSMAGQLLAIPPGTLGTLAVVLYSNDAHSLYELFAFSSVAVHTAWWIVLLVVSLLFLEPYQGLMRLFNSDSLGAVTARRLLPPAIFAPIVLSWLGRSGESAGFYDSNVAAAIVSLSMMITLGVVIYTGALKLHRVDLARRRALIAEARVSYRLRRANIELQQFAYSVSHDLRGPLATILGLSGLVQDDLQNGEIPEAQSSIVEIERSAQSLSRLVQDTLELTQSDIQEQRLSRVSVRQLVNEVLEEMAHAAVARGVDLAVDATDPTEIQTEPTGLKSVLRNLVENAIKYRDPAKPTCWVRVVVRGDDAQGVRIEVVDNGLGIPEADQKDIFKIYRRLNPEAAEGSGIGLALVRRQTACLGGTIELESSPDGTTFIVSLPPDENHFSAEQLAQYHLLSASYEL